MRILDQQQLQALIDALIQLQPQLLPNGADLLALIAELEGAKPTSRGFSGLVRCMGEPAAQAVRDSVEQLKYAFPLLKVYLTPQARAANGAEPQIAALVAAMDQATLAAAGEFEKLMSAGALSEAQVAEFRKELEELGKAGVPPAAAAPEHATPQKAMAAAKQAEAEMMAEIEKLLKAANLDPAEILPLVAKIEEPKPDAPPPDAGHQDKDANQEAATKEPPAQSQDKRDFAAELEKAEQQARSNLPELEKQLERAGVDRSAIDELMALLKAPG